MFMTLLHFTMSLKDLVVNLVGLSMMALVAVGYKTKLVSLIMVCWLLLLNFVMNDFWRHRSTSIMWDFKKYDFFQVRFQVSFHSSKIFQSGPHRLRRSATPHRIRPWWRVY